ncbi:MAG: T9SS type A sorting domain-containing protein, partial [Bacteroidia bacterium]
DFYLQNPTLRLADRWGNFYHPLEVAISEAMAQNTTATCQAGLFTLHFQDVMANNGLGFDAVTEGALRRNVVKEVFEDLSASLDHAPYNGRVHLLIESSTATNGTNDELAYGSAISLFPTGAAQNNFQTVLYKTIRSGASAYQNTPLQNGTFYQGLLGFNFGTSDLYNLDYQTNSYTQPYDLYTVTLHQALHLLGLAHASSNLNELNRSLSQAERENLNDLGYEMTEEYGDDDQETPYVAYTIQPLKSCNPLANDDFYTVANGGTLVINSEGLLPMVGYLNNDIPNTAASVNVSAVTQVTPAIAGTTTALAIAPFTITFNAAAGYTGWVEITYVLNCDPMGNTASQGTIWIWVGVPDNLTCPAQNICGENIVCYGDFEAVTDMNAAPFSAFDIGGFFGVQSPDLHVNTVVGTVNLTATNLLGYPAGSSFMDNTCSLTPNLNNLFLNPNPSQAISSLNNNYLGMGVMDLAGIVVHSEGVALPLSIPLQAGENFQLQYEAFNFAECGIAVQFMLSDAFPCPDPAPWATCGINADVPNNLATGAALLPQPTNGINQWETHTLNLSVPVGVPTATHLVVFAQLPPNTPPLFWHYGLIDNISIIREPVTIEKVASTPANGAAFQIGETVTYTVTVTNTSAGNSVNNVSITDILPEYGLDFASFALTGNTSAGITATLTNNQLQSNSFTLLPSQSITLEYEFVVTAQCSLNLVNCATVNSPTNVNCVSESCVNIQTQGLPVYDVTQASLPDISPPLYTAVQLSGDLNITTANSGGFLHINNARVVMPSGTKMFVNANTQLTIAKNSLIEGCNTMWKGIEVAGVLTVDGSTLQDAERAVLARHKSVVNLNHADFRHNVVGLDIPDNNGTPTQVQTQFQGNNLFWGGQPFLPPYPAQLELAGAIGKVGIRCNSVVNGLYINPMSGPTPSGQVTFRELNMGVYAEGNMEVNLKRCTFQAIQRDVFYGSGDWNGSGVVAMNGVNLFQTGWGSADTPPPGDPLTFDQCLKGIYLQNSHKSSISLCRMNLVKYGIVVSNNVAGSYTTIYNNNISTFGTGIYLRNNTSPTALTVNYNALTVTHPALGMYANTGILATDASGQPSNLVIKNNTMRIDQGAMGVYLNDIHLAKVYKQNILLTNAYYLSGHKGIYVNGGGNNGIQCNRVNSLGLDNSLNQAAIQIDASKENLLECNKTNIEIDPVTGNDVACVPCNSYHGLKFNGDCSDTELKANTFGNHEYGLWLSENTAFGLQGDAATSFGNVWNGNYGIRAAHHNEGSIIPPPMGYPNITNSQIYMPILDFPTSIAPTAPLVDWFIDNTTPTTTFGCSVCATLSTPPLAVAEGFTSSDTTIANDSATYYQYPTESDWQAKRNLYEKCQTLGTTDNPLMSSFISAMENYHLAELAEVSIGSKELSDDYAENMFATTSLYAQQESLSVLLRVQDSILLDTLTLSQDSLTAFNIKEELIAQLTDIKTDIVDLETDANTEREQTANTILTANGTIDVSAIYEENERVVNEIYLSTLVRGIYELDEGQVSLLEGIIHQCPMSGGTAVYRARALYAMYNMEEEYDDSEVCNSQGISWRQMQATKADIAAEVNIYPNPTEGKLTIELAKTSNYDKLFIYNSLGQIVRHIELAEIKELKLDVSNLPKGVYFLSFMGKGVSYHKLIIE